MNKRRSIWFIGAGFSYDLGMPLVWELTKELRDWLTPQRMIAMGLSRGGADLLVAKEFAVPLADANRHYEQLIGWLEDRYLDFARPAPHRDAYRHLRTWLNEMVGHLLTYRHTNNEGFQARHIGLYAGLQKLAEKEPLWMFSLNHDVCVEMIASHFQIPLASGITRNGAVKVPHRTFPAQGRGTLVFDNLTHADLVAGNFDFIESGSGINLVKLHGSLDLFAHRDHQDFARPQPVEASIAGWSETLRILQTQVHCDAPWADAIKTTNEIPFTDVTGKVQFLGKTLLSGTHKFTPQLGDNAPPEMLGVFEKQLAGADDLIVIGYSFGDDHLNSRIRTWLEGAADRRVIVVDPFRTATPDVFADIADRFVLRKQGATDYVAEVSGMPHTESQRLWRGFSGWVRRKGADFIPSVRNLLGSENRTAVQMQEFQARVSRARAGLPGEPFEP